MEKITVFEAALEGHVIGVNLPKSIHFLCDDINKEARVRFVFTSDAIYCLRANACALCTKVTQ